MTTSNILNIFSAHKKAYIGYLTAGDGGIKKTLSACLALIKGGITLLEIGVPFSDPIADGPVIQRACDRAILAGTTFQDIFWLCKQLRLVSDIPLILFSYLNPILSAINNINTQKKPFFEHAAQAGIQGLLILDCPLETPQSLLLYKSCLKYNIAPIYIITPYTSLLRLKKINQTGKGFLYYACRKGTTGERTNLPLDYAQKLNHIKAYTNLPIVSGFGISTQKQTQEALLEADGVVIGSLFVKALENNISMRELTLLVRSINPLN